MSKYIESTISAAAYQRCKKITIYNPYMETPTVQFEEEQIFKRSDGSAVKDNLSTITKLISNYNETFPIYNPVNQTKTGQVGSIAQLYAMIWSVYMNEAVGRDAHLARVAVMDAASIVAIASKAATDASVAAVWSTFNTTDATNLVSAIALADTKSTQEEKDVVMADYATAKATAYAMAVANVESIMANYTASEAATAAQALINAQAAYDAIITAG